MIPALPRCKECNRSFVGQRIYCSPECRASHEVREALRPDQSCDHCSDVFAHRSLWLTADHEKVLNGTFCSESCWTNAAREAGEQAMMDASYTRTNRP